jgi:hypothetical protein
MIILMEMLLLKDGKFILEIFKRIPKLPKYTSRGILAVDLTRITLLLATVKLNVGLEWLLRGLCTISG